MPVGPGKYDEELVKALKTCVAQEGILIIMDGKKGNGFSTRLSIQHITQTPHLLRQVADQIEASYKRGQL